MFIILDILLMIMMMIVVYMIFSGFISLLDSKVMAMTQNSIGPGLFLFGICTPIFDGVKLILKFGLIILNVDLFYLFLIMVFSLLFNYTLYFMMPLSNMLLMNMEFNHFFILSLHTMLLVIDTFLVGCFMMNTCFVYLATISTMLFSLLSEFCMLLVFMIINNFNFFALFNFLMINVFNLMLYNYMMTSMFLLLLIIMCMYLQNLVNIFEFSEAESELVAGTMTEFSGVFFCMSSLIEISHVMLSAYLMVTLLFGGFFISFKIMIIIICLFLVPKLLLCSLKMNNALLFIFYNLMIYLFLYFLVMNVIKLFYFVTI